MLKTKLFRGFAILIVLFSLLSAVVGIRTLRGRVVEEAQTRVRLDLTSARHVLDSQVSEIRNVVRLVASKQLVQDAARTDDWSSEDLMVRLERLRATFGLDFLTFVDEQGKVMKRSSPPYTEGDYRVKDHFVEAALSGKIKAGLALMTREELSFEADGLGDRAFFELRETPHARRTARQVEERGMVMIAAAPIQVGPALHGAVYGGVLVNRNHDLADAIHDIVYDDEKYKGVPVGTATIFLYDTRIATTVRGLDGNRALATRVSREVADQVLDNGKPWIGEAFVVKEWYLTAYEPIRDGGDQIIGMLYVGILKRPFRDYTRNIAIRYLIITLVALLVGLALAFYMAGRLAQPIHCLVEASNRMRRGENPGPVKTDRACHETATLIHAFNQMAATLVEREEKLVALNRSYMETLGFVSHELKSPVATIMNYVYLMREGKLGPLTEKQQKAMKALDVNSNRLVEMVRHYLNLSRIENGELEPVRSRVSVLDDVLNPLLDSSEASFQERRMRVVNTVPADAVLYADLNMVREVFENLLSNAVKYGRDGGEIQIRGDVHENEVVFGVRNEGEGIPRERLCDLFKKFSRLESPATRQQKGTGLGLFITQSIVAAHGGKIEVTSEPGAWVDFSFTFPTYRQKEERAKHV
jgi:two-component system NtrC family sensor kinase